MDLCIEYLTLILTGTVFLLMKYSIGYTRVYTMDEGATTHQ